MGKDLDPGDHLLLSPWKFASLNCTSSVKLLDAELLNKHRNVLPVSLHASNGAFSVNASMPFAAFGAGKSLQNAPALITPLIPSYGAPDQSAKKLLVFDQSGDKTRYMFWSSNIPEPYRHSSSHRFDLQQHGIEEDISDGDDGEEMHENTEEIDALLYSDSSDEDPDEEEASTGHSPVETAARSVSESASSVPPAKRRRANRDETDASVMDTASSVIPHDAKIVTKNNFEEVDNDAESSCVKGGEQNLNGRNKQLKRVRIQETMSVLQKIIPGGKNKDTATLLDDAIRILKSLQTKANFAATSL